MSEQKFISERCVITDSSVKIRGGESERDFEKKG